MTSETKRALGIATAALLVLGLTTTTITITTPVFATGSQAATLSPETPQERNITIPEQGNITLPPEGNITFPSQGNISISTQEASQALQNQTERTNQTMAFEGLRNDTAILESQLQEQDNETTRAQLKESVSDILQSLGQMAQTIKTAAANEMLQIRDTVEKVAEAIDQIVGGEDEDNNNNDNPDN